MCQCLALTSLWDSHRFAYKSQLWVSNALDTDRLLFPLGPQLTAVLACLMSMCPWVLSACLSCVCSYSGVGRTFEVVRPMGCNRHVQQFLTIMNFIKSPKKVVWPKLDQPDRLLRLWASTECKPPPVLATYRVSHRYVYSTDHGNSLVLPTPLGSAAQDKDNRWAKSQFICFM